MTATIAEPRYDSYEDARTAAEVTVIRVEMQILPALRAMDAAWLAYIREDFMSHERRAAGLRYLAALSAYDGAWDAYCKVMAEFRLTYPER